MTYDDWKLRSDRDEYPQDEPEDDIEPWDEPVPCTNCKRTHELQESYFCLRCRGGGECRKCRVTHSKRCSR